MSALSGNALAGRVTGARPPNLKRRILSGIRAGLYLQRQYRRQLFRVIPGSYGLVILEAGTGFVASRHGTIIGHDSRMHFGSWFIRLAGVLDTGTKFLSSGWPAANPSPEQY